MMNANDARIAKLTVAKTGSDLQEVAPNAPDTGTGTPATAFDLVLEMEAGSSVAGQYSLVCTCFDHTAGAANNAMNPGTPLNGTGFLFANPPWGSTGAAGDQFFDVTVPINVPSGVSGHTFSYTIALVSNNYQQVDTKQSPLFILV